MTTLRVIDTENYLADHLQDLAKTAKQYLDASLAPATRKAYASDWQIFADWCYRHGVASIPASPDVVALFLSDQAHAGIAPSTLTRRTAAIKLAHESAGHTSPTHAKAVSTTMKGIRNTHTTANKPKSPLTVDRIAAMVAQCPDTLTGLRDQALLLLGFAGAFRRSELVAQTSRWIKWLVKSFA